MSNPIVTHAFDAHEFDQKYYFTHYIGSALFNLGNGDLYNNGKCYGWLNCDTNTWSDLCDLHYYARDWFKDPWDLFNLSKKDFETGVPYRINADWNGTIILSWQ